jgi:hypothetical protein
MYIYIYMYMHVYKKWVSVQAYTCATYLNYNFFSPHLSPFLSLSLPLPLLPHSPTPSQELNPGVQQYACTCLQNHCVWSKNSFWRHALFLAIQAELVRIYSEVELQEKIAGAREKAREAREKSESEYHVDMKME